MSIQTKEYVYDLEKTRQWAIAAENEVLRLQAEAVNIVIDKNLQNEVKELELDVQYWYEAQKSTLAELQAANALIAQLTLERDALYASFN